jgi:hypothetical protein
LPSALGGAAGIVHLTGGLKPAGGSVVLDVSGTWGSSLEDTAAGAAQITTTDLDRALRAGAAGGWAAPIVILEAATPESYREATAQLLLRNAFAAELYALGGARAVIATFYNDLGRSVLHSDLGEYPIGQVVQRVRWQYSSDAFAVLICGATALWCDDPRMRR